MTLLKRQTVTFQIFDDQGPTLWGSYIGNWTHYTQESGFNNNTVTATPTSGASLSFTFSGSQAWLYGALLNTTDASGNITSYPTADYQIDDSPVGSQKPYIDSNGAVVYFQTPKMADGTHEIDIIVRGTNATNPFIIDYFLVTPLPGGSGSGVETSRNMPTSTSTSTSSSLPIVTSHMNVGAIVGGVVGGVAAIAILATAVWYFLLRKSRGTRDNQAYYFDKPNPGEMLATEAHVEPFDATATTPAPSSTGFSGPGPQSAYSNGSSTQPLNPAVSSRYSQSGPSEGGITTVSSNITQPRTGKAALMAQQYQNVQQPVQYEDSGVRFNENEGQEAGPSQVPNEVPPTYTPN